MTRRISRMVKPMCRSLRGRCSLRNGLFGLVQVQVQQSEDPTLGRSHQRLQAAGSSCSAAAGGGGGAAGGGGCCSSIRAAALQPCRGRTSSPARRLSGRYEAPRSFSGSNLLASLLSIPPCTIQLLLLLLLLLLATCESKMPHSTAMA